MRVFVSWSGDASRQVAKILKKWVPRSLLDVELFVSDTDIKAGERWAAVLGNELSEQKFAIVCLTAENAGSTWLNFEAGAISKTISESLLVPFLFKLEISNVDGPLSQFQAKNATRDGYLDLLNSLNAHTDRPKTESDLKETLEIFWPRIQGEFDAVSVPEDDGGDTRDVSAILSDVILSINDLRDQVNLIENRVSPASAPASRLELLRNLFQAALVTCSTEALKEIAEFCRGEVNRVFSERILSESERAYGNKLRELLSEHI